MARVVAQDAHQHDRIVLHAGLTRGRVREELADAQGGLLCGVGTRFCGLDDGGEVEVLVALVQAADQQDERPEWKEKECENKLA